MIETFLASWLLASRSVIVLIVCAFVVVALGHARCHHCAGSSRARKKACEEHLNPHFSGDMHECTKCRLYKDSCPAQAIPLPFVVLGSAEKKSFESDKAE